MAKKGFLFIVSDSQNPGTHIGTNRRLINSHVHKVSHQKKRQRKSKSKFQSAERPIRPKSPGLDGVNEGDQQIEVEIFGDIEPIPTEFGSSSPSVNETENSNGLDKSSSTSPPSSFSSESPQSYLDSSLLDPFLVTSVPINQEMTSLIYHYFRVMSPPARLEAFKEPWVQLCPVITAWARGSVGSATVPPYLISLLSSTLIGESILIYSICSLASAHRHRLRRNLECDYTAFTTDCFPVDLLYYQGRLLETLGQVVIHDDSDPSSIFASICLLGTSVLCGQKSEIYTHMKGLNTMINVHGGWYKVPANVSHVWLGLAYMCAAWTNQIPPKAPPLSDESLSNQYLRKTYPKSLSRNMASAFYQFDTILDEDLLDIVSLVSDLTIFRENYHSQDQPITLDEIDQVAAFRLDLEHRIMSRLFSKRTPEPAYKRSILVSLLVFLFSSMMTLKTSSGPIQNASYLLKKSLPIYFSQLPTESYPQPLDMVLWTLFMGAHIATDMEDNEGRSRVWYISNIGYLAKRLGIINWQMANSTLERYFYVERIFGLSFRNIWSDATQLSGNKSWSDLDLLFSLPTREK